MQQIGDIILQYRMKRRLTQQELARLAAVPQPNLSNIEKGKQDVTVGTLQRIATVLGCSLSDFFREIEREPESISFSRNRIEKLAEGIVAGQSGLTGQDAEIARLFQDLRPHLAGQASPKRTYSSWRRLRALLSKSAIQSLHERVRDAEMRSRIQ